MKTHLERNETTEHKELKMSIIFENQEAAIKALCKKVFGAEVKYKHEIIQELHEQENDER